MSEPLRALAAASPLLLMAVLAALLRRPLRGLRERDKSTPPSPRALTLRLLPFVAVLAAGGVWGLAAQRYELVVWGVVGVLCFGYGLVRYARQQE